MVLQGLTYKGAFHVDVMIQDVPDRPAQRLSKQMGYLPIMVRSSACYLRHLTP